jgi:hypothetical protein
MGKLWDIQDMFLNSLLLLTGHAMEFCRGLALERA